MNTILFLLLAFSVAEPSVESTKELHLISLINFLNAESSIDKSLEKLLAQKDIRASSPMHYILKRKYLDGFQAKRIDLYYSDYNEDENEETCESISLTLQGYGKSMTKPKPQKRINSDTQKLKELLSRYYTIEKYLEMSSIELGEHVDMETEAYVMRSKGNGGKTEIFLLKTIVRCLPRASLSISIYKRKSGLSNP